MLNSLPYRELSRFEGVKNVPQLKSKNDKRITNLKSSTVKSVTKTIGVEKKKKSSKQRPGQNIERTKSEITRISKPPLRTSPPASQSVSSLRRANSTKALHVLLAAGLAACSSPNYEIGEAASPLTVSELASISRVSMFPDDQDNAVAPNRSFFDDQEVLTYHNGRSEIFVVFPPADGETCSTPGMKVRLNLPPSAYADAVIWGRTVFLQQLYFGGIDRGELDDNFNVINVQQNFLGGARIRLLPPKNGLNPRILVDDLPEGYVYDIVTGDRTPVNGLHNRARNRCNIPYGDPDDLSEVAMGGSRINGPSGAVCHLEKANNLRAFTSTTTGARPWIVYNNGASQLGSYSLDSPMPFGGAVIAEGSFRRPTGDIHQLVCGKLGSSSDAGIDAGSSDTGVPADATADGGQPTDGGQSSVDRPEPVDAMGTDAGIDPIDAIVITDAGEDAGVDPFDAIVITDAGADAGTTPDAQEPLDAGAPDATEPTDGGIPSDATILEDANTRPDSSPTDGAVSSPDSMPRPDATADASTHLDAATLDALIADAMTRIGAFFSDATPRTDATDASTQPNDATTPDANPDAGPNLEGLPGQFELSSGDCHITVLPTATGHRVAMNGQLGREEQDFCEAKVYITGHARPLTLKVRNRQDGLVSMDCDYNQNSLECEPGMFTTAMLLEDGHGGIIKVFGTTTGSSASKFEVTPTGDGLLHVKSHNTVNEGYVIVQSDKFYLEVPPGGEKTIDLKVGTYTDETGTHNLVPPPLPDFPPKKDPPSCGCNTTIPYESQNTNTELDLLALAAIALLRRRKTPESSAQATRASIKEKIGV